LAIFHLEIHWQSYMPEYPDISINGSLLITEAGTKKRESLHFINGRTELTGLDPGGLEVFEASLEEFRSALLAENHTLKRSLTDPHTFSGIGNTYSDEILVIILRQDPFHISQPIHPRRIL
jgi:formamidopyrimidine-DNA glycosylase